MIKPIQLLKDSFATYKANIKNIIFMTWPIALLTIVAGYYSNEMDGMGDYKPVIISVLIIGIFVNIIVSLLISLFLQPALFRSIQKNEDNKIFDVKDGYDFQKKNIWNYIVLYFWTAIYSLKVNWKYILVILTSLILGVLVVGASFAKPMILISVSSVFFIISVVFAALMIIRNLSKFIYPANVFFSSEITPREAVKKSIELGVKHNNKIWLNILSYILFMIILMIVYFIIGTISGFIPGVFVQDIVTIVLSSLVVSFISTPMAFMIYAKGYNILKEEKVEQVVVSE